ncbi:uncharacterized protein CANTADRAFT_25943 [Suhomyces tanzawaensis NRRL Y-17324]|uniref:ADP-ribosylation factor GTPase-activating protein n=1 Tax=Suhomyces tanzawaensis NRRL Y-17324 TaxID=984487 RepID=A0A1E4SLE7_9ASCO|nr:uncharacterized protein CANTADRAFT_25943 [Suhomyces tanzawaensis NRRL Y-17324]ODV80333.1 hypothetical protein CANTADRAFT_25943 [Suhomyces tanzawaensis NRRL Y-17324]
MNSLSSLVFPYERSGHGDISLNKVVFLDHQDTSRLTITLKEGKDVDSVELTGQNNKPKPVSYIDNPQLNPQTPLLVRIPSANTKLKISVSIRPTKENQHKSLVLVKSYSKNDDVENHRRKLKVDQMEAPKISRNAAESGNHPEKQLGDLERVSSVETAIVEDDLNDLQISKIEYALLPIEHSDNRIQKIIINDTFRHETPKDSVLNLFVWEYDDNTKDYQFLFKFNVWIDEVTYSIPTFPNSELESATTSTSQISPPGKDSHKIPGKPKSKPLKLSDLKKSFHLIIEDGPEFRNSLKAYEGNVSPFKKVCQNLLDELRGLDHTLKRLLTFKAKVVELIYSLTDLLFNPILRSLGFPTQFQSKLNKIIEPFEKNLKFLLRDVFDLKLIQKLCQIATSFEGASASASTNSASSSSSSSELTHLKKNFEANSKEFYSWLNKYLSNDKERSKMKLLLKRKAFELSKFDYLNQLNLITNNQYLNQLLEKLFKFVNLDFDVKKPTLLNFNEYNDLKLSQNLLTEQYEIYLNVLLRFNSEKYQLRQMIEASQSNEELTRSIRYNRLSYIRALHGQKQIGATDGTELSLTQEPKITDITDYMAYESNYSGMENSSPSLDFEIDENTEITKENLDMIFSSGSDKPNDTKTISQSDLDQGSDISGILYTLGGQGKQGWHKEWVVLDKGRLIEYSDWRKGTSPINKPIEVALSNVKALNYERRQNCFEIMTSSGHKHVFQAINEDERDKWMKALYNAGQVVNTSRIETYSGKETKPVKEHTGKSGSVRVSLRRNGKHNLKVVTDFKPPILNQHGDRSVSPISISSQSPFEKQDTYYNLVRAIPNSANHLCVDCGSLESVEWISINYFVCFCVKCASCHRNLGSHISKIRSLKLDKFDNEVRFLLKYVNNAQANSYLEGAFTNQGNVATPTGTPLTTPTTTPTSPFTGKTNKPDSSTPYEQRLEFIREKYISKAFISKIPEINTVLLKAVQKINIQEVLRTIACGADVNLHLQIPANSKHESQLISVLEYSLRKFVEIHEGSSTLVPRKLFVISELLILNGCKTDNLLLNKEFLTPEALEYWKHRRISLGADDPGV